MGFHLPKCASRQKLREAAGPFSVGDLFHQKSFTLTCSQTFPGMSPAMAHGLSALKWRMRCWEPSLWLLHHPVTGLLFVEVSSHPTPPTSSCVQRSPGCGNESYLGLLPHIILQKPKSIFQSGVQLCAMYCQETVASCSNSWQQNWPEMLSTSAKSPGAVCGRKSYRVFALRCICSSTLHMSKILSPTDFSSLHLETGGCDTWAKPPTSVCKQL